MVEISVEMDKDEPRRKRKKWMNDWD
jgi:hypothetical protein